MRGGLPSADKDLRKAGTKGEKSPHYDAVDELAKNGADDPENPGDLKPEPSSDEYTVIKFHDVFSIMLLDDDKPFKHKGKAVYAEVLAVKIIPADKELQSIVLLGAVQRDSVTNPTPAKVIFNDEETKYLVHFECELPLMLTTRGIGQLILEK